MGRSEGEHSRFLYALRYREHTTMHTHAKKEKENERKKKTKIGFHNVQQQIKRIILLTINLTNGKKKKKGKETEQKTSSHFTNIGKQKKKPIKYFNSPFLFSLYLIISHFFFFY